MIQKHRIRLNSTETVNSVNKDNKVVVELKQSTKPYFFTDSVKEQIDQYETFQQERGDCTKYRLITTIKPYCTNILFNTVTEIVKNEGSNDVDIVTDLITTNLDAKKAIIYGKTIPNRIDMIRNTEYSQEGIDYEYHVGYDIFNNHLLRNKSFKIVIPPNDIESNRTDFNTIRDFLRDKDGKNIPLKKRKSINDIKDEGYQHLYEHADLYDVNEAINNYLIDDNGWVGFVNKATIVAKKHKDDNEDKEEDVDYNHIINSKESCDFIDMYPDRTLYSFNPKYNFHKHKPEYNWKTYLTYPYENFYDHELIKDGTLNAVLIQDVIYTTGVTGQDIFLFKTYIKHNLIGGSVINLYYKKSSDNVYNVIENVIISDIGDLDKNNDDFYFYTTDTRLLTEIEVEQKGKINNVKKFRFKNVVNGCESEYYIRKFRKLPNLLKSREITEEDVINKENLEKFIGNCTDYFDNETYNLGFSNTIYNDDNTQITFTDSIEIDNLIDNRGRPLTEIYLTIVKNNKGNHVWYNESIEKIRNSIKNNEIEYSHCFSDITFGFDLFFDGNIDDEIIERAKLSDVKVLHTSENTVNDYNSSNTNYFGWNYENVYLIQNNNVDFIGDIVEYNDTVCVESILSDGQFRFNTYLRDNPDETHYKYLIDEMEYDDYDLSDFKIKEILEKNTSNYCHPEGYYYKAHYPIMLREWGELQQASHFDLKIKSATKVNIGNKICAVIKTTLPHKLSTSDTLLICCDEQNKIMQMQPTYVFDELTFAISDYTVYNYDTKRYEVKMTASDICDILRGKYESINFQLRRYNNEIPFYASKTPNKNRYMWRVLNNVGNRDNVSLPEYPFANGCFYINQDINFYLKRQDPFGKLGLYYEGDVNSIIPNDPFGTILTPSEYEYKEESEVTC